MAAISADNAGARWEAAPGAVRRHCGATSEVDKDVEVNGVRIIGLANMPGRVAVPASQMYSANMSNFLETYWNAETKQLELDWDDEIIQGCVVTHNGDVKNERVLVLQEA